MQEIPYGQTDDMYAAIDTRTGKWQHFFGSRLAYITTGDKPDDIHRVRVTIDPEGDYWGWWYSACSEYTPNRISMIFSARQAVEICFAYGSKSEEERDRGRVVRLKVVRLDEPCPHQSNKPPKGQQARCCLCGESLPDSSNSG